LTDRKHELRRLLSKASTSRMRYVEQVEQYGTALFQSVCKMDLEGIVAKHSFGNYVTEHERPLGRKPGPQVPALSASYVPDFRRERTIFEQNGRPGRAPNGSHQAQRHAECENLYGSGS
jgi:hypothetical protein